MRIGFAGTVSVGKSTLVKELSKLPEFKDYYISTERSKYLKDLGIPLNNDSTVRGQFVFMAERASELLHDNLITDRTIWDVISFTMCSTSITKDEKNALLLASLTLMDYYDIIFYVNPIGTFIEDNNIRTTDPEYRKLIDTTIKNYLDLYPPKNLVEISGPTESRIKTILSYTI
jgi:GTPase SAR1 family protein